MYSKKVLIIGGGISGFGAAKLSVSRGYNTVLTSTQKIEKNKKDILIDLGVKIEEGQNSLFNLISTSVIVKSPGVPPDIPLLLEAKNKKIEIVSEIEFASAFTDAHITAITGTNGKTTTSTLLWHILKSAGINVDLVGNIGKSFSESILEGGSSHYIIELSSFQLEDIIKFKPDISILLNCPKYLKPK